VISGVALLLFYVTCTEWFGGIGALNLLELRLHDLRFNWRKHKPPASQIAIVGITASSLDQSALAPLAVESEAVRIMRENSWPWPRSVHARVIERLFESGARAVAVDIGLPTQRDGDDELVRVLKKYEGRVVLATVVQVGVDNVGRKAANFLYPHSEFTEAAGSHSDGTALYSPDVDGTVRRFDFRTSELREHFKLTGEGVDDDSRDLCNFAVRSVELFTGQRQADRYGEIIDFAGPANTYTHLPVEEIFIDRIFKGGGRIYGRGDVVRDKLVFYGPVAEIFHDVHQTPFGVMPGVEIHAQIAGALLEKRTISPAIPWAARGLTFGGALFATLVVLFFRNPLWQVLGLVGLVMVLLGVSEFGFTWSGVMFPMVPWMVCSIGTGAFGIVYLFLLEQWEKAHTRKVLERSINKRIAKVVLNNAEEFDQARRGERRPVTILFSDIRGFTTWSEKAEPENLVGQLNEYFERMVDIVERDGSLGNAQKFIGDAILAAWGDTPENRFGDAEDVRRAVVAALRMREALKELNITWDARPDREVINIGIGINHGEVVVGEVGHPERGEYTVLGDGVNFAARLESATKQFHTDCLVGESVEALTRGKFVYRHADYIRVKGKTKPVNVFFPLSESAVPPPEWLGDYHRARGLYLDRKFEAAADLFRGVRARIGQQDYLCELYLTLCLRFVAEPPPENWDGSRELTEK
jgi:adenylate cyclase